MTIEIHQPELEALIEERLSSGRFQSVEEVLLDALRPPAQAGVLPAPDRPQVSLAEVFGMVRGLGDDVDFSRDPTSGRPVDLS